MPEFGGQKVDLADGEFYLFRDTEILGVLENWIIKYFELTIIN